MFNFGLLPCAIKAFDRHPSNFSHPFLMLCGKPIVNDYVCLLYVHCVATLLLFLKCSNLLVLQKSYGNKLLYSWSLSDFFNVIDKLNWLTLGFPVPSKPCAVTSVANMSALIMSRARRIQLCWRLICFCSSCHWLAIICSMSFNPSKQNNQISAHISCNTKANNIQLTNVTVVTIFCNLYSHMNI